MNKENAIRRRIASTYNKPEDDFPSLRAYNDYLEEVEDIKGVNVQETEAKIKAYQEENADQIIAARAKKAERIAQALREEKAVPIAAPAPSLEKVQDNSGAATGIQLGAAGTGQYAPSVVPGTMFMQPRPMGPSQTGDGVEDPEAQKLREQRGARAGGWTAELTQRRAIEEAMCSLWIN
ncbi:unnamed protein product [Calypogeia fissa]